VARCANAMMVSIGLTPEALGNAEPSTTSNPSTP
jgi:hypothetical protein